MSNVYEKENKASEKQKIKMRLTFLDDRLRALDKEKIDILADIVTLKARLGEL